MQTFELLAAHVLLLRAMCTGWQDCEWGAPEIDPKRPYGNSSVYHDIAEICGIKPAMTCPHCGDEFDDKQRAEMDALHRGTETALQVALATGSFTPGMYEAPEYSRDWVKVNV